MKRNMRNTLKNLCYGISILCILFMILSVLSETYKLYQIKMTWMTSDDDNEVPYASHKRIVYQKAIHRKINAPSFMEFPTRKKQNFSKSQPKIILWYNHPFWLKKYSQEMNFSKCAVQNCVLSSNTWNIRKSAAVIFEHFLPPLVPKKSTGQKWAFLTFEPPTLTNIIYRKKNWKEKFDWIISYHRESDIQFPYGKVVKQEDSQIPQLNYSDIFVKKTGFAVLVQSNCFPWSKRGMYVDELSKYIPVAHFGRCGNMTCEGDRRIQEVRVNCHRKLSHDYKFFLAFENSLCDDYTSERFYNQLRNDNYFVPVVRGDPNIDKYLPKGTYIDTNDFETPKKLAEFLMKVASSEKMYTAYLREKHKYKVIPEKEMYHRALCTMCQKLHDTSTVTEPRDIQAFLTYKCYEPMDLGFNETAS